MDMVFQSLLPFFDKFFSPAKTSLETVIHFLAVNQKLLVASKVEHEALFIMSSMFRVVLGLGIRAPDSLLHGRVFVTEVGKVVLHR